MKSVLFLFHPLEWRVFYFFFILNNECFISFSSFQKEQFFIYSLFILQNEEYFISVSSFRFRMKSVLFLFHPQEWRVVLRRWTVSCTWWAGACRPWSHATALRSSILSPGRKSSFKSSVHCTYLCHSEAEHQTFFVKELQAQDVIFRNWFEKFFDVCCVLICTRIN